MWKNVFCAPHCSAHFIAVAVPDGPGSVLNAGAVLAVNAAGAFCGWGDLPSQKKRGWLFAHLWWEPPMLDESKIILTCDRSRRCMNTWNTGVNHILVSNFCRPPKGVYWWGAVNKSETSFTPVSVHRN